MFWLSVRYIHILISSNCVKKLDMVYNYWTSFVVRAQVNTWFILQFTCLLFICWNQLDVFHNLNRTSVKGVVFRAERDDKPGFLLAKGFLDQSPLRSQLSALDFSTCAALHTGNPFPVLQPTAALTGFCFRTVYICYPMWHVSQLCDFVSRLIIIRIKTAPDSSYRKVPYSLSGPWWPWDSHGSGP